MHAVRPTRTRLTGALAALALAAALTACGSDASGSADDQVPAAPSSSATDETTPTATDEPSQIDDGAQVDVAQFVRRLQAGIDNTDYAHIDFTMGGAGGEMTGTGDVDYTVKPPNMQMSMAIGPETVGMLLVDKTMYVQSSQAGGKYIEYDLSDPNNPLGSGLSEQLDPAGSIEAFTKAVSSVTSSGEEDVDGRTLSRYVLTVDTTQLGDQSAAAGLPAEMEFTVWLDDQDRMAKTSMAMGPVQYDATLSDFDKAVELEAPPKDQVVAPPAA
jgi:outer membrane lipoprotein-sorting protein